MDTRLSANIGSAESRSQTQTTPAWIASSITHGEGGSGDLIGGLTRGNAGALEC